MQMYNRYELLESVLFDTGHGFSLWKGPPGKFSVWQFTKTACGCDYYWGYCIQSRKHAEEAFQKKANEYKDLYKVAEKSGDGPGREYYRYYSRQRPVDVGTYPAPEGNKPLVIINYGGDSRRPVAGGLLLAWGEITYLHPLTQEQARDYELVPSPII